MTALPAADYLVEFGPGGEVGPSRRSDGPSTAGNAVDRVAEAYTNGFEKGKSAARATLELSLRSQKIQFERELKAARGAWAKEMGETLAQRLTSGLQEGERRIAEAVARILKPFLGTEIHRQAIADLHESLDGLIALAPGPVLEISAPPDVLEGLRRHLAEKVAAVSYHPSDDCDVRVTAGATVLETHFASWIAKIEEATR